MADPEGSPPASDGADTAKAAGAAAGAAAPGTDAGAADAAEAAEAPKEKPAPEPRRFGTFLGVYIPSILTILGVIMYLRLGWVVGEAGIVLTVVIVTLASSITFITGLSIAATATNMRVRGGGAYFMVSRSFGVESGAAIGLPLYLAQATGVSFYLAGFAESVQPLLPGVPLHLIGLTALVVLTVLAFVSANLALKTQILIFLIIAASLISLAAGHPVAAVDPLREVQSALRPALPFWAIFAVFFPAVTGIEAGISMSGDLKDPRRSLPLGTISAVLTGYAIYLVIPFMLWHYVPRAQLRSNPLVMWDVAWLPQAMYAGIWGATLSSAMGALLGGSRTLQALAQDRVVPRWIGHGSGPGQDPRLATVATFAIAAVGLYAGSLDALAPILSMFFLTSYGTLNLIAALEGLIGNPSWRPTFRTPWRLSALGAALSVGTMLMIDAGSSFIAIGACSAVYLVMRRRRMRTGWSDIRGGILQALARFSIYRVGVYQDVARVWRPNILLFSGAPTSRWYLVQLADAISHGKGFLTVVTIIEREFLEEGKVRQMERSVQEYLARHKVPALVRVKYTEDFAQGVASLSTDYGLGHIEPNTIMLGATVEPEHIAGYCAVLRSVNLQRKNLIIVRDSRGQAEQGIEIRDAKTIDVWMATQNNNATLMLLFAYMLQSSPEWRGAGLTIRSLAPNEDARRGLKESLAAFMAESRIDAEIEVYVQRQERSPFQEMARYSAQADLVFMGLRAPEAEESAESYAEYYGQILEATRALPLTIITLAGEEIEFKEVFS
jgi:amino acid transporter